MLIANGMVGIIGLTLNINWLHSMFVALTQEKVLFYSVLVEKMPYCVSVGVFLGWGRL